MDLCWPQSAAGLAQLQRERKLAAFEAAKSSPLYKGRLDYIDSSRLEEEWQKIPLLTKDELRKIEPGRLHEQFCILSRQDAVEYWRSGGVTGKPMFYPRSQEDMKYAVLSFARAWALIEADWRDCAHISFPLGIHPVGHLFARSAETLGIGTVWAGSGANTPSLTQLELIRDLKPTIWAGMASYGLHLANLAEVNGIDLRSSSVTKIIVAAEPLSPAKRAKLEHAWGAEVFDHFGKTESAFVTGESGLHQGLHVWSDLFFLEVVDEATGQQVPDGEVGSLVVTPLFINSMTPFLRWVSGDLVSLEPGSVEGGFWRHFPVMRHARRTVGFFKIRGVNINHSELEDVMFGNRAVLDFKAEAIALESGNDALHLLFEVHPQSTETEARDAVAATVRAAFENDPVISILPIGTIGQEFEASVKAARFVDKR